MKFRSAVVAALASLCLAPWAFADSIPFTFSGSGVSGSLILSFTPDPTTPNAEDISSVNGTLTIGGVTSIVNGTPAGSFNPNADSVTPILYTANNEGYELTYDNLFYNAGTPFDSAGIVFTTADGQYTNLFNVGSSIYLLDTDYIEANQNGVGYLLADPSFGPISSTPEPSSLVLQGTGCLSLCGAVRRRLFRRA